MTKHLQEEGESITVIIDGLTDAELSELERIKKKDSNGLLHPEKVLQEAQSSANPLHGRFKWDDAEAGNRYRLAQARALIACVKVVYPNREPVRYYPYVRTDQKGYRTMSEVVHVEELRKSYLCQFATDIESLINRYRNFADLSGELQSLDKLLQKVQRKVDAKAAPKRKKAA